MPENLRVYYNLGLLYEKKGDFKNAEKVFITGLKLDTSNQELLYGLAFIYAKSNQKEKAKNILQRLIELYPSNQQYRNFINQL